MMPVRHQVLLRQFRAGLRQLAGQAVAGLQFM